MRRNGQQMKRVWSAVLALLLVLSAFSGRAQAQEAAEAAPVSQAEISLEEAIEEETRESTTDLAETSASEEDAPDTLTSDESAEELIPETLPETPAADLMTEGGSSEETDPSSEDSSADTSEESTSTEESTQAPEPSGPYSIPYRSYPVESLKSQVTLCVLQGASVLNLRNAPNKSGEILATVRRGVVLEVLGEEDGWYKVATGLVVDGEEVTGYISGNYTRTGTIKPGKNAYQDYLTFLGFPAGYQSYLISLHSQYPNWVFLANDTGESWSNAIANEINRPTYPGMSLIHPGQPSSWKKASDGYYNYETSTYALYDGSWNAASDELVAYFLDPRNFLNSTDIFQFLDQRYDDYQTVECVENIVKGNFLAGKNYKDVDGTPLYYPAELCVIGKALGVSPLYLAAVIRQEIGYVDNPSITGTSTKYPGYFNYYGVYAYTTATENAHDHGLWFASGGGTGATSYSRPWNTRIRALWGGAEYLATNYVLGGQNTLYFKKYNSSCDAKNHFVHQYMTNVMGAYSEGRSLSNGYDAGLRQMPLAFDIPVYSGLPAEPAKCPTGDGCINNRLKSISVSGYDLFPAFDKDELFYNVIITGDKVPDTVSLSAEAYHPTAQIKGTGSIKLKNGTTDYKITVTAENGDVRVYTISIYCEKGYEDKMESKYPISDQKQISGLTFGTKTDVFIKNLGLTDKMSCKLFTADGKAKESGSVMKTGDQVKVYGAAGDTFFEGTVLLYGDVNGDGNLRMSDMIKVRNHILDTGTLKGSQLAAADCNHDGYIRMSDMIKIRNEILGTGTIAQTAK